MLKSREQLLQDAFQLSEENIPTSPQHIHIAYQKGEVLADYYHADPLIVLVGLYLMDIKLKEARKSGNKSKHIFMAVDFAREFLKEYDVTSSEVDKIINCIEAHHGTAPFLCIEAEICCNADCYRFLHPIGVFSYFEFLTQKIDLLEEMIEKVNAKMQEKYLLLSLDIVKKDLETYYFMFENIFKEILGGLYEN